MGEKEDGETESPIVRLNVGGKRFMTTRSTLESFPDTFFTTLLSGRFPVLTDEKGYIFIDRSPAYFEPLLDFMRTGQLECPPHLHKKTLIEEGRFYGLFMEDPRKPELSPALQKISNAKKGYSDEDLCVALAEVKMRKAMQSQEEKELQIANHMNKFQEDFPQAAQVSEHVFQKLGHLVQAHPNLTKYCIFFYPLLPPHYLTYKGLFPEDLVPPSLIDSNPPTLEPGWVVYDSELNLFLDHPGKEGNRKNMQELLAYSQLTVKVERISLKLFQRENGTFFWHHPLTGGDMRIEPVFPAIQIRGVVIIWTP